MSDCADCGTRLELNGTCPNCHEELFIATWQGEYLDYPLSEEFDRKVDAQSAAIRKEQSHER
jgi:hypothetical protein